MLYQCWIERAVSRFGELNNAGHVLAHPLTAPLIPFNTHLMGERGKMWTAGPSHYAHMQTGRLTEGHWSQMFSTLAVT